MDTLTYQVSDLQECIEANRVAHQKAYREAMSGFREQAVSELYRRVTDIQHEKTTSLEFNLPAPQSHEGDYDTVLTMLEMTTETEIELTEHDFRRYVMDQWDWSANFLRVCSGYAGR
jgi:hypothetical protein